MQHFTVDASVILKWIGGDNEPDYDQAKILFDQNWNQLISLIAPDLLKIEVANVLLKKKHLSPHEVHQFIRLLDQSNTLFIPTTNSLLDLATKLAHQYDLSVYDGIYLATAQESDTMLISADTKHHGPLPQVILLSDLHKKALT
jgi:predicted nucleic acid-binding protein